MVYVNGIFHMLEDYQEKIIKKKRLSVSIADSRFLV